MDPILEAHIDEFCYPRGTHPAIRSIDLEVRRQDFIAVVGPAGAGKTTLCHCLAGVIPHFVTGVYRGSVRVAGRRLSELRLPEIAPLVGFVQQRPENQLFNLTVEEDVAFGPENLCLVPDEIRRRVVESLVFVGMKDFAKRAPDTLSGGEAQRVVLSSVLAMGPELFVLDQPAAELDPEGRKLVYSNLCRLNRDGGRTVILVEDRLDDVLPFLTRVILMLDGRIVKDAPPTEFFADEALPSYGIRVPGGWCDRPQRQPVGRARRCDSLAPRVPCRPVVPDRQPMRGAMDHAPTRPRAGVKPAATWYQGHREDSGLRTQNSEPVSACSAHDSSLVTHHLSHSSVPGAQSCYALEAQGLGFRYPKSDRWALKTVNLGFRPGEFAAIIGGNGAGKTTLAKQLAGLLRPTEGRVLVSGWDVVGASTSTISRTVRYLFQDPDYQLFCNSVFDEATFSLKIARVPPKQIAELVDATLQKLGLFSVKDHHPYVLSRGQRQRLALASILVREPGVLVVDEPTTGLDYRETIQMMDLLAEFRRDGGTVIMITHDMEMLHRYAERTVVMAGGKVELDTATVVLATDR